MQRAAAALIALGAWTSPAHAQSVSGTVVDSVTGDPVRRTVVVLLDSTGARRGAALVDALGRFELRAPQPGTYRVRSQQIGIRASTSVPLLLTSATQAHVTLRVNPIRVALPAVLTEVTSACVADETASTAADSPIWTEVEKALTATTVASGDAGGSVGAATTVRDFTRELDPRTMKPSHESARILTASVQRPYASLAPDSLARYGYVVAQENETIYYAPDAATLMSSSFAASHCWRERAGDGMHSSLVGVEFRPLAATDHPDIRGVLWIDSNTSELRYLEYSYTREPRSVNDSAAGGRVDFAALPSGAWIVRYWVIRMPQFEHRWANSGLGTRVSGRGADSVLAAIVETGGEVMTPAAQSAIEPGVARPPRTATIIGSVLTDQHDMPVVGAEVSIAPGHTARTDSAGHFQIDGVAAGDYTLVVRHIGEIAITLPVRLVAGDTLARDFVLSPSVPALDTVNVRARFGLPASVGLGKMGAYARRRAQGVGRAVDSTTLLSESYRSLGDVVRAHFPIHLIVVEGSAYVASTRGQVAALDAGGQPAGDAADQRRRAPPACYSQVFVDGIRVYRPMKGVALFDLNSMPITSLQAAEYFPGPAETPAEYGGPGASCGTLLLWTK